MGQRVSLGHKTQETWSSQSEAWAKVWRHFPSQHHVSKHEENFRNRTGYIHVAPFILSIGNYALADLHRLYKKIHTQTAQAYSPPTAYPSAAVFFFCTCFSLLYFLDSNTELSSSLALRGTTQANWLKEQFYYLYPCVSHWFSVQ